VRRHRKTLYINARILEPKFRAVAAVVSSGGLADRASGQEDRPALQTVRGRVQHDDEMLRPIFWYG
jgi:hypothetical protein